MSPCALSTVVLIICMRCACWGLLSLRIRPKIEVFSRSSKCVIACTHFRKNKVFLSSMLYLPVSVFWHFLFSVSHLLELKLQYYFFCLCSFMSMRRHIEGAGEPCVPTSLVLVTRDLVSFEKGTSRTHWYFVLGVLMCPQQPQCLPFHFRCMLIAH